MADNGTDGTCRILELPVELTEHIVTFGNVDGLLNLRATCRDLEAKTRSLLINYCFHERTFLLADRTSMSHLRGISEHPVFSRSLHSIILAVGELRKAGDVRVELRRLIARSFSDPRTRRIALREKMKTYVGLAADERRFRDEQELELIAILKNFLQAKRIPAISAVSDEHRDLRHTPAGTLRLQRLLGDLKPIRSTIYFMPEQACNTVLKAIVKSGFPPLSLELGGPRYPGWQESTEGSISPLNFCFEDRTIIPILLRRLALALDVGTSPAESDEEWEREWPEHINNLARLSAVLGLAPNLTELALEGIESQPAWRRSTILSCVVSAKTEDRQPALMKLECFKMEHIPFVDVSDFVPWVETRRHTLRVIEISGSLTDSDYVEDVNDLFWNIIWAPGKRDMKVMVNDSYPGMARGAYCSGDFQQRRFRWVRERRTRPHMNDDCECPSRSPRPHHGAQGESA